MSARSASAGEEPPGDPAGEERAESAGQTSDAEKEEYFAAGFQRFGHKERLDDEAAEETSRASRQCRSRHKDGGAEGQEKLAEGEDQQGDRRPEYKDDQQRKCGTHDLTG
jgi:hypothetical protein